MIVPEVLTGHNYGDWKIFMKTYLLGQGLWDIVEGTERKPEPNSPEFKRWREKNGKALHAILISCREEIFSSIKEIVSAKDAWDQLALKFPERPRPTGTAMMVAEATRGTRCWALFQAVFWGESWERTKSLLDEDSMTAIISPARGTVLHVAVGAGHLHLVKKLVELMTSAAATTPENPDSILTKTTRECPDTPLNVAARCGFTEIAEFLVNHSRSSLQITDKDGLVPVATASRFGHKDTVRYLYEVTTKETLTEGEYRKSGATLLIGTIFHDMYDIAVDLLGHCPQLAIASDFVGGTIIRALATIPNAFPSGELYSPWQRWIYTCAPIYNERDIPSLDVVDTKKDHFPIKASCWLYGVVWSALNLLVPGIKSIQNKKRIHVQALKVLKCICSQISSVVELEEPLADQVCESLFTATKLGIIEMVNELIKINPNLLLVPDKENRNIFSVAILYRQEKIFNLIRGIRGQMTLLSSSLDKYGNTVLHLAGKAPSFSRKHGKVPGAALQMQRELQWFQEVEKTVPSFVREFPNSKGLNPREQFTEEHKKLGEEGEKWMKDTSGSCMVVATLIATFTFAAAFTAPGGFNQETGFPIFLTDKLFFPFIISDALSLFSSATSVLMFLSIYTSRYAEDDFLELLPKRLIIGLSTLFFSMITMMVAFCAAIFLILSPKYHWISIAMTSLAFVPVALFLLLQFPIFLDMVHTTYGPGLFKRPSPKNKTSAYKKHY